MWSLHIILLVTAAGVHTVWMFSDPERTVSIYRLMFVLAQYVPSVAVTDQGEAWFV
jgi:hypothetical protein